MVNFSTGSVKKEHILMCVMSDGTVKLFQCNDKNKYEHCEFKMSSLFTGEKMTGELTFLNCLSNYDLFLKKNQIFTVWY